MRTEWTWQVPGTRQMLNEFPLTLAFLSLGRMSVRKPSFMEASGEKARVDASHMPTTRERALGPCCFPGEPQTALNTSQHGPISLLGATSDNRESRWVRAADTVCTGASHPHLLLGPGEEDALDIIYACPKVGRHDVGAQIPHLIAATHQGLPHLLLTHWHHCQPGLPSQVP